MSAEINVISGISLFGDQDYYLFAEGTHVRLFDRLGAHPITAYGEHGCCFSVWAPNASGVAVAGDFNAWDTGRHALSRSGRSGIWEGFVPRVEHGAKYKYAIDSDGFVQLKSDPFASFSELPPGNASIVWNLSYQWQDAEWMRVRRDANSLNHPVSFFEVHLGSWRRGEGNRWLTYREIAPQLIAYVKEMGFSHVEFLPVMEHPFYGSWGYQATGYFAPTSRYGTPQDLMWLIDQLHQSGIGVILDWVPSHFPNDPHGLAAFDGTHLYEYEDPRQGKHGEWDSLVFDYARPEVRSFLLSSAMFWLEKYHADGLRVDAVASMLYRDYAKAHGAWIPNQHGGRENLEAISFLRRLTQDVHREHPDVLTVAEESTAFPMVTGDVDSGGLGFDLKWDMGWRHDTLEYLSHDPLYRKFHHGNLTFRMMYVFSEKFVLPLTHDEVARGKGSLMSRIPGDNWQKFATMRLLTAYMFAQPGKKLLFMGVEFGQWAEWDHDGQLDWALLGIEPHAQLRLLIGQLNFLYRSVRALWENEFSPWTFEWIEANDAEHNILSFIRRGSSPAETVIAVCNFSPVPRPNYRIGAPSGGWWTEILNTDASQYGGSGHGNFGGVEAAPIAVHNRTHSLTIVVPPLALVLFRPQS